MNFWKRPSKKEVEDIYKKRLECILANPPNHVEYQEGMDFANKLENVFERGNFLKRLDCWFYKR